MAECLKTICETGYYFKQSKFEYLRITSSNYWNIFMIFMTLFLDKTL